MSEQLIGECLNKCPHCEAIYHGVHICYDAAKENKDLDLENCTIREREMFEIGFAHGKRVALTEMKRQMEEVLCDEK